ncbi:hypothetical protein I4U23_016176 [Adineta vaga]|nr:hypothetical protein I4U23_016176 [Adineta vaga]
MLSRISTIELMSIELCLNRNINEYLRGISGLKLFLKYGSDLEYVKNNQNDFIRFFNTNVWSLHYYQETGKPFILTDETLEKLKHLTNLRITVLNNGQYVLDSIVNFLSNHNNNTSLKYLLIEGNIDVPEKSSATVENHPIHLKYLFIHGASIESLCWLLPTNSQILSLRINTLHRRSYNPLKLKTNKIDVNYLQIDNINYHYPVFEEIQNLIDNLRNLKKLYINCGNHQSLVNGNEWAILLNQKGIEIFSLKFTAYREDWRDAAMSSEKANNIISNFQNDFWVMDKHAVIKHSRDETGVFSFSVNF